MADELSTEEKETLKKVMERAKEFDQANKEGRLQTSPTEGQLYKWTNPLKGWQPRWFYVNHEQGVLHYCMSEEKRKQPPRASLHLWGAVVSPSDEDSQSFTIQGSNNEAYRLKAANAKDRQSWVTKMRMEVEHANSLAAGPKESLPSDRSTASLALNSSNLTNGSQEPSPQRQGTTPSKKHGRKSQLSAPLNLSLTKLAGKKKHKRSTALQEDRPSFSDSVSTFPGGDDMLDSLTRLQNLQDTLLDQIETILPAAGVSVDDRNILLLKATSQAAVQSVHDSLAMLNVQMGVVSVGASPVHSVHSPINAQSPSRKVPLRNKRPKSMIDTTGQQQQHSVDVENDLDDILLRSASVVEVGANRKKVVPKVTSKEAP